jgi:hypothetical protein
MADRLGFDASLIIVTYLMPFIPNPQMESMAQGFQGVARGAGL